MRPGKPLHHRTRFASVSRIPGGSALRVSADGSTLLERYWSPESLPGPDPTLSTSDCAELLRERIDTAIRRLVPDDVPVGGHVSGGLDCTAMSCRANQVLADSGRSLVAGYSWSPDEQDLPRFAGDERSLLDEVAAQESLSIWNVRRDRSGSWFFDLDPDRYPQTTHVHERFVLPQARADGVEVMVSGWGGDELASFNGRGVLRHLVRRGHVRSVWNETGQRMTLTRGHAGFREHGRSFAAAVLDATPDWFPDPRHRAARRRESEVESEADSMIRELSPFVADARQETLRSFDRAADHHEMQLALLTHGHLQDRCDGWYQTGRLFGVSYRYPLLDLDVVTTALNLPWWAFRSQGWTRTAFRMAVEPWVPASVAWNVTKTEPALFAPRPAEPGSRPRELWRADDEQLPAGAGRCSTCSQPDDRHRARASTSPVAPRRRPGRWLSPHRPIVTLRLDLRD